MTTSHHHPNLHPDDWNAISFFTDGPNDHRPDELGRLYFFAPVLRINSEFDVLVPRGTIFRQLADNLKILDLEAFDDRAGYPSFPREMNELVCLEELAIMLDRAHENLSDRISDDDYDKFTLHDIANFRNLRTLTVKLVNDTLPWPRELADHLIHLEELTIRTDSTSLDPVVGHFRSLRRLKTNTMAEDFALSSLRSLPASLGNLTSLNYLEVHFAPNVNLNIPPELGNLHNLSEICIRKITPFSEGDVPDSFGGLTGLRKVTMDQWAFSSLPSAIFDAWGEHVEVVEIIGEFVGPSLEKWHALRSMTLFNLPWIQSAGRLPLLLPSNLKALTLKSTGSTPLSEIPCGLERLHLIKGASFDPNTKPIKLLNLKMLQIDTCRWNESNGPAQRSVGDILVVPNLEELVLCAHACDPNDDHLAVHKWLLDISQDLDKKCPGLLKVWCYKPSSVSNEKDVGILTRLLALNTFKRKWKMDLNADRTEVNEPTTVARPVASREANTEENGQQSVGKCVGPSKKNCKLFSTAESWVDALLNAESFFKERRSIMDVAMKRYGHRWAHRTVAMSKHYEGQNAVDIGPPDTFYIKHLDAVFLLIRNELSWLSCVVDHSTEKKKPR